MITKELIYAFKRIFNIESADEMKSRVKASLQADKRRLFARMMLHD